MSTPQEILAAIELLAPDEQRLVAQQIREAFPLADEWTPDEAELAELDRRMDELESGKVESIPGPEVMRLLHDRMNRYE
jgi:putative addiction module component (TIGR02574 family)